MIFTVMQDIPFDKTPILRMLSDCLGTEKVSYHMPGHFSGLGFPEWLHRNALRIDTTEFALTDDLIHPQGRMAEALELARAAFVSGKTFFVTTGASIAVHAAVYTLAVPGSLILAGRNSHRSFAEACRMFGLTAVFAEEAQLPEMIGRHPEASMVFITRPDYEGHASDIRPVMEAAHRRGIPVAVDEAHGTHFAFAPDIMPLSALSAGGDIVIHSAHKTTPALTQGAFLHLSRGGLDSGRVSLPAAERALTALTTSSPSFLIAATLDYARAFLETAGLEESIRLYGRICRFYDSLENAWLGCLPNRVSGSGAPSGRQAAGDSDPFRIVIRPYGIGITPGDLVTEFAKHGVFVEYADITSVVLICKFANSDKDFALLSDVMNRLCREAARERRHGSRGGDAGGYGSAGNGGRTRVADGLPEEIADLLRRIGRIQASTCGTAIDFGAVRRLGVKAEAVPLEASEGRILFTDCIPYPPGVPLLFAGHIMTFEDAKTLLSCVHSGLTVNGILLAGSGCGLGEGPSVLCYP